MKRRRDVSGGHFLRSEDDPHGSQEPRRSTHRTTLEGIPSASRDTVRELADAAHVTPGQISRYEHGRDRISHERVTELARIILPSTERESQPHLPSGALLFV